MMYFNVPFEGPMFCEVHVFLKVYQKFQLLFVFFLLLFFIFVTTATPHLMTRSVLFLALCDATNFADFSPQTFPVTKTCFLLSFFLFCCSNVLNKS